MKIEPFNPVDYDYVPPGELRNGPNARAQKRFELIPFDKIAFDTAPAYLVKGLIPRVGLCVFWGPPKCGKSFLVFDLLMHVALGWKYRGRRVRQGAVVYCALEGCAAFKNRVEAFRLTHASRQRQRGSILLDGLANVPRRRSRRAHCLDPRRARHVPSRPRSPSIP